MFILWKHFSSLSNHLDNDFFKNLFSVFHLPPVASKALWPEYKIIQEFESDYDTQMPDDDVNANSMVSRNQMDDGLMSIADSFEVLN